MWGLNFEGGRCYDKNFIIYADDLCFGRFECLWCIYIWIGFFFVIFGSLLITYYLSSKSFFSLMLEVLDTGLSDFMEFFFYNRVIVFWYVLSIFHPTTS